jgi:hypothetical protein
MADDVSGKRGRHQTFVDHQALVDNDVGEFRL